MGTVEPRLDSSEDSSEVSAEEVPEVVTPEIDEEEAMEE
jgi:hypothetical protein